MKLNKTLRLTGLATVFSLAVGCAGPAEQSGDASKAAAAAAAAAASETAQMEAAAQTDSAAMSTTTYEVNSGDHLWGISAKSSIYGNPYKWPLIYKANSDKISDADLIHPGQVLDIDTNPSDADSAAAINHAKSRGSWSIGVTEKSDSAYLAQ